MAGKVRLLGEVADRRAGLEEAHALVGLDQPGGDLEQGRLARAVAADEAGAVAGSQREVGAIEQRRAAEGERDALEGEERRSGHGRGYGSRTGKASPGGGVLCAVRP